MSNAAAPIEQLPDMFKRLDLALAKKLVRLNDRFLYTVNGAGKLYEGTLHEISPLGHVRLNTSGVWDWPPEIVVEELLAPAPVQAAAQPVRRDAEQNPRDAGATPPDSALRAPSSAFSKPSTKTKSPSPMKSIPSILLSAALLLLGLSGSIQAQQVKTNDLALPFAAVIGNVNSNILTWGNSGGYAAAASTRVIPSALGMNITWSFSCATATLAAATCVIQGSVDNTTWHNVPGLGGAFNVTVPASAASANNTNVVYSTNLTQAQCGLFQWWRIASMTNGNAATLTPSRVTATTL